MNIDLQRASEMLKACGYECVELESLRQRLAEANSEIERKMDAGKFILKKLAEAQAALAMKDKLLSELSDHAPWGGDTYSYQQWIGGLADEALAVQPGTEALEKWLGEPVAIIGKHGHPKHISAIPSIEENRLYGPFEPLYAKPKGIS